MSVTIERLASLIQRELVNIVNDEVKSDKIGYINLTEVRVTKDLSYANIFYTILKDDKEALELIQKRLDQANAKIRMRLAEKIKNIRKIPELIFKYDEALAYGNHIDQLLKTIK
jgi:ribosome-binding factor A